MANDSWDEWRRTLISQLETLQRGQTELDRKLDSFRDNTITALRKEIADARLEFTEKIAKARADAVAESSTIRNETAKDLAALNVKSGVWGLMGAAIPTAIAVIWVLVGKH